MNKQSFKFKVFAAMLLSFVIIVSLIPYTSYGAASGIVYHFQLVNDGLYGANITTLEFDANYPNTIYAGTANEGIFVSSDLGKTWKWIGKGLELNQPGYVPTYVTINAIETVKGKFGAIYVGTSNGLYLSNDSGLNWSLIGGSILKRRVFSIYISDKDPNFVLVGTDNGVCRSVDSGQTFEVANKDITNFSVYCITPDSSMKDAYYIGTNKGIFKTPDNADSWNLVSSGLQSLPVYSIAQNPKKPYILYAAVSTGVYRTYDYGDHWTNVTDWESKPSVVSVGIDSFDDRLVLAVARQGILLSKDSGETWSWLSNIPYNIISSLTLGQSFSTIYLGTNMGFAIYFNGYVTFSNQNLGLLNVYALGFDENYKTLYAHESLGLFKMGFDDYGWSYLSGALYGSSPRAFAVDPTMPNSMLAATKYGLMVSTDNGLSWTYTSLTSGEFYSVTFSKANPKYVYAGGDIGLYVSKDSGAHFSKILANFELPIYSVIAPKDGNLYALTKNYLYKSTDSGKTWNIISEKISFLKGTTLAGDYYNPSVLFLGTLDGVYISRDGGITWNIFGDLPIGTIVYSVVSINDPNNTIYLGTNSGVYKSVAIEDNNPPTLKIISPQDNAKFNSPSLTISGIAADSESGIAKVTINEISVPVSSDGIFSFGITLSPGANSITIKAYDKANNITTKSLTVYYAKTTILVLYIGSNRMTTSDGETITLDSPPVIVEGRTLVPIRPIVEKFGGSVAWDSVERKVTITLGDKTLELWIGKNTAKVNGTTVPIDSSNTKVVPQIISGRTMLPVRFVSEQLGAKVEWDGTLRKITITYPAP
ncbi:MAG: stalk domain-containing protein [Caldisericum sp.]|uniref:stalk domain-containing protein n=1 Tax=Caldisericum sp. TaxID=2499687 RepID=UPI003D0BB933